MWQVIVGGAVGAVKGYTQASVNKSLVEANNRVEQANTTASNRVRGAGNAFAAARGALARYMQSLQNNQTLEAGGAALEQNLMNARREEDAIMQGDFEQAIRHSEQTGAQAAAAAFAGVGGEVADTVSIATRLSQQRASLAAARNSGYRGYDAARRAAAIASQTIRGLDSSIILDTLDYNINVAQTQRAINPIYAALAGAYEGAMGSMGGGGGPGKVDAGGQGTEQKFVFRSSVDSQAAYNNIGSAAQSGASNYTLG